MKKPLSATGFIRGHYESGTPQRAGKSTRFPAFFGASDIEMSLNEREKGAPSMASPRGSNGA